MSEAHSEWESGMDVPGLQLDGVEEEIGNRISFHHSDRRERWGIGHCADRDEMASRLLWPLCSS